MLRSGLNPADAGGAAQTTLTVAIADSADPVLGGANVNYTVVVTNTGAADATNVTCLVALDPTLTYVSSSGTGWTTGHSAGTVTCTRATLVAGAAPTITITVTSANADSTESTTADADADNSVPATQDTETTVVVGQTTLTVVLADSADPVPGGDAFDYTVVVTNTGANTATTVEAVVVLDATLAYVSGSGSGWAVGHSAGTVTCTRASLAVGAAPTITINVRSTNASSTESSTADADSANSPAATQDVETTVVNALTAPVYQAQGAFTASTTVISPAWPAGHQADDIALCIVEGVGAAPSLTVASGFALIGSMVDATGSTLSVYWCRATGGTQVAPTITVNNDHCAGQILTFRGVRTSGNPYSVVDTAALTSASASVSILGLTTTGAARLIVGICTTETDTSGGGKFSNWANASLASADERTDQSTAVGNGGGFAVVTGIKTVAGVVSATTADLSVTDRQAKMVMSLVPAGG